MCAVCYSFTPKPDATAIQFLIFFAGLTGVGSLFFLRPKNSTEGLGQNNPEFEGRQLEREDDINKRYTTARASRFCLSFWRIFNRFLKVVHWAMSVMFIAGAMTLALSYRFTNPYVT